MKEKTESIVYVVQESRGKNVLDAERYGRLVALFSEDSFVHLLPENAIAKIKTGLGIFSDDDYLLLIGSPILIGCCVAIAAKVNHGKVACLQYDKQEKRYFEVRLNLW